MSRNALADLRSFVVRGQQAQRAIDAILAEAPTCACCVDPDRIYPPWKRCDQPGCTNTTRGARCPQHQKLTDAPARTVVGIGAGQQGPPAPGRPRRNHGTGARASRPKR